jgi:hypothetical protein
MRENSAMNSDETTKTSPTLLGRTVDWRDDTTWQQFVSRHAPLFRLLVPGIPPQYCLARLCDAATCLKAVNQGFGL